MKNVKLTSILLLFILNTLLNFGCVAISKKAIESEAVTEQFTIEGNVSTYEGYWTSQSQIIEISNQAKEDAYYAKYEIARSDSATFQSQLDSSRCKYLNQFTIDELNPEAKLTLHGYFSQDKYFLVANLEYTVVMTNEKIRCAISLGKGDYETVGTQYVYLSDINASFTAIPAPGGQFKLSFNEF